jgi:hypothetical protein
MYYRGFTYNEACYAIQKLRYCTFCQDTREQLQEHYHLQEDAINKTFRFLKELADAYPEHLEDRIRCKNKTITVRTAKNVIEALPPNELDWFCSRADETCYRSLNMGTFVESRDKKRILTLALLAARKKSLSEEVNIVTFVKNVLVEFNKIDAELKERYEVIGEAYREAERETQYSLHYYNLDEVCQLLNTIGAKTEDIDANLIISLDRKKPVYYADDDEEEG